MLNQLILRCFFSYNHSHWLYIALDVFGRDRGLNLMPRNYKYIQTIKRLLRYRVDKKPSNRNSNKIKNNSDN